jgi:hypothetical protein
MTKSEVLKSFISERGANALASVAFITVEYSLFDQREFESAAATIV